MKYKYRSLQIQTGRPMQDQGTGNEDFNLLDNIMTAKGSGLAISLASKPVNNINPPYTYCV